MVVVRSPNYPAISLADAIARVDTIFKKEHKHPTHRDVLAKDIGYGSFNGASSAIISALHKYGLLEPVGNKGQYKVSDEAVDILLHRSGDSERVKAIQRAAFMPSLFSELHSHYGDSLPSDQNIRMYLLKKDFNPKTVDGVIRTYRDTIEFVNVETEDSNTESLDEEEVPMQTQITRPTSPSPGTNWRGNVDTLTLSEKDTDQYVMSFKIAENCDVQTVFTGPVTKEALETYIKFLELSKEVFPNKASLEQETDHHENKAE